MPELTQSFAEITSQVVELRDRAARGTGLTDSELLDVLEAGEALSRAAASIQTALVAECVRRSPRSQGRDGLAARMGFTDVTSLVQQVTRSTRADAGRQVRLGTLLVEAEAESDFGSDHNGTDSTGPMRNSNGEPLHSHEHVFKPVVEALATGEIAAGQADAVVRGLAQLQQHAPADVVGAAAEQLVSTGAELDADQLARQTRRVAQALTEESPADRDERLRAQRYLAISDMHDGLHRIHGLLDPESVAIVRGSLEAVTRPRKRPRFEPVVVSDSAEAGGPAGVAHGAEPTITANPAADTRTTGQKMLDALVDLVAVGAKAAPERMFGTSRPAVNVITTLEDLEAMATESDATIEGSDTPVSIAGVGHHVCDGNLRRVVLGADSEVIDVGRGARLFTPAQRAALAVRDGGCRWFVCDRPPSWTEAHHINTWSSGGETNLEDGILLCRHHHMTLHSAGWRITRGSPDRPGSYLLHPPPDHPGPHEPIELPPNARAWRGSEQNSA